jgi:putative redox protein
MKCSVTWVDNARMIGESGSGHSVVMDGPEEFGGRNIGIRPMEMLLIGMGGCMSFDVVSILKKTRQSVQKCETQITAQRADDHPKVFTNINVHFVVTGEVDETKLKKAIDLSHDKYCSASIMLGQSANITHSFEVIS